MEAKTKKETTLKETLNPKDYHDLLEQNEVYKHEDNGLKNICIMVHPGDFPITNNTKSQAPNNFAIRGQKDGIYMVKISLCELIDPITKRITGTFINSDGFSEYENFELDLDLD
jgi:hypothetical protein